MNNVIFLSEKNWHKNIFDELVHNFKNIKWHYIDKKNDFTPEIIASINPIKIFIPHWSYIIPESIFKFHECIVFHMTDLPFGRGGSPLQNLIVLGFKETVISAVKVEKGIDTGEIYLKKPLNLSGTANEIFLKASDIIKNMIAEIIQNNIIPQPQIGDIVEFKRRKPEEGNMNNLNDINKIYDYIRMLDCDGYPNAFIETDSIKIEFTNANFKTDNTLTANVRIFKK